ncbi:hypothetical protein AB0F03_31055 [Streptomyces sp. NPDC028722]
MRAAHPRTRHPLRDYVDDIDSVRVIYYVTALRQITIVAYVGA